MVRDQEQVGEWEETVLEQVPPGIVFALVVGRGFLTKQAFPAIT